MTTTDTQPQGRAIDPVVMARHYEAEADMLRGMAILLRRDLIDAQLNFARSQDALERMRTELQEARETIAQRDAEIAKLDAGRAQEE